MKIVYKPTGLPSVRFGSLNWGELFNYHISEIYIKSSDGGINLATGISAFFGSETQVYPVEGFLTVKGVSKDEE